MSSASDISNLFQMVGGDPSQYQEVEQTEQMQGSRGRWNTVAAAQPGCMFEAPIDVASEQDLAQPEVAREAEAPLPVETAEVEPAAPPRLTGLIDWALPAPDSEPPPVVRAPLAQPAARANPEPVAPPPQSAPLSSVFARLLERDTSGTDASSRRKS